MPTDRDDKCKIPDCDEPRATGAQGRLLKHCETHRRTHARTQPAVPKATPRTQAERWAAHERYVDRLIDRMLADDVPTIDTADRMTRILARIDEAAAARGDVTDPGDDLDLGYK